MTSDKTFHKKVNSLEDLQTDGRIASNQQRINSRKKPEQTLYLFCFIELTFRAHLLKFYPIPTRCADFFKKRIMEYTSDYIFLLHLPHDINE